jgi:hypothetical protein
MKVKPTLRVEAQDSQQPKGFPKGEDEFAESSPRLKARIAGALYLIVIITGVFAEIFVRDRLLAAGDAVATAQNILAHEQLYRLGFAAELIATLCNMPLAVIFYDLFKVVNRSLAWLVVFLTLVGSAVESVSLLAHFAPLILLGGGQYLSVIQTAQLQAEAYMAVQLFEIGFSIALVFFGSYCITFGYLIFKSTFMPRIIGVLLAIEGLCYLVNSFANFLAPEFAAHFLAILMVSGVAEISLMLWLLVMGVNPQRWKEQAAAAGASIHS